MTTTSEYENNPHDPTNISGKVINGDTPLAPPPKNFSPAPVVVSSTLSEKKEWKPTRKTASNLFPTPPTPIANTLIPSTPETVTEETSFTDEEVYEQLFNEKMPPGFDVNFEGVLEKEDEELFEQKITASEPSSPIPVLYGLAQHKDWEVRERIARNSATPVPLLALLAKDGDDFVRQSVMENPNCPENIYVSFATDEEPEIVVAWIENSRTTPEMFSPLYDTDDDFIAEVLTEHPGVPNRIKHHLTKKHDL